VLALFRAIRTDEPTGIHRIALNADGSLIGRKALGIKRGSAVKLWGEEHVHRRLCAGEGIETVIAAAHFSHKGESLKPAWALIDAENLKAMPILPGIEDMVVLADHDEQKIVNGAMRWPGQEAARAVFNRYAEANVAVEILIANEVGDDFNDVLSKKGAVA
jgi:hypothetical protein